MRREKGEIAAAKRVAVFQYQWPLQIHTANFVEALAAKGYHVDLFIKRCRTDLVDLSRIERVASIRLINLNGRDLSGQKTLYQRVQGLCERLIKKYSYTPIILPAVIAASRYLRKEKFDFFIGVEKMGMIWACFLSKVTGTPFVYYSLELYDEGHPEYAARPDFPALRRLEKKAHQRAAATIIQDRPRKEHLFRTNGLNGGKAIFMPVSVPGPAFEHKKDSFRAKWGIPSELPVVLYLGIMEESRHCLDMARAAQIYGDKFRIVFHGYGNPDLIEKIRSAGGDALTLSTELVPEDRLPDVVGSADIGLAFYRSDCANNLLTAFSSEKVALYCRAGVPFISFDTPSYRELVKNIPCCVLIREISEMPQAIETIMSNYATYRANALEAFRRYYQFETNIERVIGELEGMFEGPGKGV